MLESSNGIKSPISTLSQERRCKFPLVVMLPTPDGRGELSALDLAAMDEFEREFDGSEE